MNPIVLCLCQKVHLGRRERFDASTLIDCEIAAASIQDGELWFTNTRYLRLENLPVPRAEAVW